MGYQLTSFIISNLFFWGYIGYIIVKYGVQSSVSYSWYKLDKRFNFVFTLVTWGYALSAIIAGVDYTPLVFLAGAGIAFVGASPMFIHPYENDPVKKSKYKHMEGIVHVVGAIVGIGAMLLLFILPPFNMWFLSLSWLIACGITYLFKKGRTNITWWAEIYAYIALDVAYLTIFDKNGIINLL